MVRLPTPVGNVYVGQSEAGSPGRIYVAPDALVRGCATAQWAGMPCIQASLHTDKHLRNQYFG
jgi:hypothetical protein